jgi:hypothetical protein
MTTDTCLPVLGNVLHQMVTQVALWLGAWNWQVFADSAQWLLSLGLFTTIVSAILTSRRDRLSRERDRRSQLAQAFLQACATALAARLNGTASSDDPADAALVFSHQMLIASSTGKNAPSFNAWVTGVVRDLRFGQPPPTLEQTVTLLGTTVAVWVQNPTKATIPGRQVGG